MSKPHFKILVLATAGTTTQMVCHQLEKDFGKIYLVLENPISKSALVRGRVKRLGWRKTFGQLLFIVGISPVLRLMSRRRRKDILKQVGIEKELTNFNGNTFKVASVNDDEAISLLQEIEPNLVIVNGTRIISKRILASINCPIINIHTGITPKYRGVHGGYWALTENDLQNFGTTLHHVDQGIDTGAVLAQIKGQPTAADNFATYPLLQYQIAIEILSKIVGAFADGCPPASIPAATLESKLWYHPTAWEYLKFRISRQVK